uniref:Alstonine synthase n=1 Tax=Alstonia scholaris TaxID=52822 RepID=AS_ALSSC|nr:alstonine synthase [Alstonia scholaris]
MATPQFSCLLPAFFLLVVFLFLLIKELRRYKSPKTTQKLPPGPPMLPIIGNLHQMASSLPHQNLKKLADKYGPLMHLKLGEISAVAVSSPRLAKEVLQTRGLAFADRPQSVVAKLMLHNCLGVTFSRYGDYWRQLRQIFAMELLSSKSVQSFSTIMEDELFAMVKSIESEAGRPIILADKLISYLYATLSRATLGRVCKGKETLIEVTGETLALSGAQSLEDIFPSVKIFAYLNPLRPKVRKLFNRIDGVLEDIINQQEKKLLSARVDNDQLQPEENDMLSVLLKLRNGKDSKVQVTNNDIKAIIFELFLAGTVGSSTTVEWAMSEMMKNPKVMEKAQHEVREVLKGKKRICQSDIQKLSYLKLVVKETLRLHPPAPLLFPRECRGQCEVDGYTIPAKAMVMVNCWALGRDPEHWIEADKFEPERFKNSSIDFIGNHFEYIPFGAGRRICPGISFGATNVELLLAALLYHFDWELAGGMHPKDLDMLELFGPGCTRKNPLSVIPSICIPSHDDN